VERRKVGIRQGVRGPGGQLGFLLMVPPDEALDWDVQQEITSTSRHWMASHQAWWIAAPYLSTARMILHRFEEKSEPAWLRLAGVHLPKSVQVRLRFLLGLGSSLRGSADRA
jgi:hypothetical protein